MPKSYFEYRNRNIFKVYAVFKTRPQGKAILKPTCLHFGTLKGWKHPSTGFPSASQREPIWGTFFSCFKMCLERQLGGQKVPQQPQKAARRLSGEGGERHQNRPKSRNPPKTRQTPRKGAVWPPLGTTFSIILSFYFDILDSAPSHFVELCWVYWKHAMFLDSFHTSLYQFGTFSAYSCAYELAT